MSFGVVWVVHFVGFVWFVCFLCVFARSFACSFVSVCFSVLEHFASKSIIFKQHNPAWCLKASKTGTQSVSFACRLYTKKTSYDVSVHQQPVLRVFVLSIIQKQIGPAVVCQTLKKQYSESEFCFYFTNNIVQPWRLVARKADTHRSVAYYLETKWTTCNV